MATSLEIVNQSLYRVGQKAITSSEFSSPTTEAGRVAAASWPFVRREVLTAHSWNAITVRATLTVDATAPDWDFDSRYALPNDTLRVLEVNTEKQWRVEGQWILVDATGELEVRYLEDTTDPSEFGPVLTEALVLRMAVEIVERITNSRTKRETLLMEYEAKLHEAREYDSVESSPMEFEEDDWILARY